VGHPKLPRGQRQYAFASAQFQGEILAGDGGFVRLLRFPSRRRARGNFAGPKIAAVLWTRRCRLWPILLAHLCGRRNRKLHDGSDPTLTREDPRYYTLGRGGFIKRTGYAVSRLFITRTDAGKNTFNLSEEPGRRLASEIRITQHSPTSG
jgi:hypothetical protein